MRLVLKITVCALLFTPSATSLSCEVVGRIEGLFLGGKSTTTTLPSNLLAIDRGGRSKTADNGLPLCAGDVLVAASGAAATIRLGTNAGNVTSIQLDGPGTLELSNQTGIRLRVGRIFAAVKGMFETTTDLAVLGAQGTEFRVDARPDAVDVVQLEGSLQVRREGKTSIVNALQELTVSNYGAPAIAALSTEACYLTTDDQAAAAAATLGRPPAKIFAPTRPSKSPEAVLPKARREAICLGDRTATSELVQLYSDWADPTSALRFAQRAAITDNSPAAVLAAVGTAYRLSGEWERAERSFQQALQKDPRLGAARSGMADVSRDQALALLAAGKKADAAPLLARAEKQYRESLNGADWDMSPDKGRAIPIYNLADVLRLQDRFREAHGLLASGTSELGDSGLLRLGTAKTALATGDLTLAADQLQSLSEESSPFQHSSLAAQLRGQLALARGDPVNARDAFRRATELDPRNTEAYLRLASMLNVDEANMYAAAARSIEFPKYFEVVTGRVRSDVPDIVTGAALSAPQDAGCPGTAVKDVPGTDTKQTQRAAQSTDTWTIGRQFNHVLIVVLENQDYDTVKKRAYFKKLSARGTLFTHFLGAFHPSYPNYLAMVGGKYFGTTDDSVVDLPDRTVADLLMAKTLKWAQYAQRYEAGDGGACNTKRGRWKLPDDHYVMRHVPFLSFTSVTSNAELCRTNILPAPAGMFPLEALQTNAYVFYTPDVCNDGHGDYKSPCRWPPAMTPEAKLAMAEKWLPGFLQPILDSHDIMKDTLIIVTFDESSNYAHNHIYTVFLGDMVKADYQETRCYDHYNVLRTIEENFGIGTLGEEDQRSAPITGIWRNTHE